MELILEPWLVTVREPVTGLAEQDQVPGFVRSSLGPVLDVMDVMTVTTADPTPLVAFDNFFPNTSGNVVTSLGHTAPVRVSP